MTIKGSRNPRTDGSGSPAPYTFKFVFVASLPLPWIPNHFFIETIGNRCVFVCVYFPPPSIGHLLNLKKEGVLHPGAPSLRLGILSPPWIPH